MINPSSPCLRLCVNQTIRWLIKQSNDVWVRLVILPPNTSMLFLSSLFLKVGICYSPQHIRPWIQLIWGNNDELKTWSKQALIFTILSRKKKMKNLSYLHNSNTDYSFSRMTSLLHVLYIIHASKCFFSHVSILLCASILQNMQT